MWRHEASEFTRSAAEMRRLGLLTPNKTREQQFPEPSDPDACGLAYLQELRTSFRGHDRIASELESRRERPEAQKPILRDNRSI